jgi:phosphonate transport system substrate-binding protein
MISRVRFAVLACLFAGAACAAEPPTYNFSPVNQYNLQVSASFWNPIMRYVSAKSGVRLNLKLGRTSADTTSYILAREVDFAFTNHLFSPEREKMGWTVFGRRDAPPVHSQIVVPADSPVRDIAELAGSAVAFPGPEALIAYKVNYGQLLRQNIAVDVVFAGNQDAAFTQLFAGRVKAVGANSQLVQNYTGREGKQFRILWSSASVQRPGADGVAARAGRAGAGGGARLPRHAQGSGGTQDPRRRRRTGARAHPAGLRAGQRSRLRRLPRLLRQRTGQAALTMPSPAHLLRFLVPRSLVGRVFTVFSLTLLLCMGTGLGLFYRFHLLQHIEETQDTALTLVELAVQTIEDSAVIGDYDTVKRTLGKMLLQSPFKRAEFIDVAGGAIRVDAPAAGHAQAQAPDWVVALIADKLYDVNRIASVGGKDYGVLRLRFDERKLAAQLWSMVVESATLAGFVFFISVALMRSMLRRWLNHLGRLGAFGKDGGAGRGGLRGRAAGRCAQRDPGSDPGRQPQRRQPARAVRPAHRLADELPHAAQERDGPGGDRVRDRCRRHRQRPSTTCSSPAAAARARKWWDGPAGSRTRGRRRRQPWQPGRPGLARRSRARRPPRQAPVATHDRADVRRRRRAGTVYLHRHRHQRTQGLRAHHPGK